MQGRARKKRRLGEDGKRHDRVGKRELKDMKALAAFYREQRLEENEVVRRVAKDLGRHPETVKQRLQEPTEAAVQPSSNQRDPLVAERMREHSEFLRGQVRHLSAHIVITAPEELVLCRTEQRLRYEVGARPVVLITTGENFSVAPDIENTESWKFLWPHLQAETSPAVAEDYVGWKQSMGELFLLCHDLLLEIVEVADRRMEEMGEGIPGWSGVKRASNWGEHGVMSDFYEEIYRAVVREQGRDSGEEFRCQARANLIALWRGRRLMVVGTPAEVEMCRKVYSGAREEATGWPLVARLMDKASECRRNGRTLVSKLSIIESRGTFSKGRCEICRVW
jgi:hypothetical protein